MKTSRRQMRSVGHGPVAIVAVALLVSAAASAGCYRRVISAQGLGSENIQTEEPYQESGEIDRWLFGEQKPTRRPAP